MKVSLATKTYVDNKVSAIARHFAYVYTGGNQFLYISVPFATMIGPIGFINIVGNVGQEPYHGIITFNKTNYEIADVFVQNNLKIEYSAVTVEEENILMRVKVPLYSVIRLESDSYFESDTGNV